MGTFVVTVRVPEVGADELSVEVREHTLSIAGPDGFTHEVTMPDADMQQLKAQLYRRTLELRAPRGPVPACRRVAVESLG
jgi:hypothetical protein